MMFSLRDVDDADHAWLINLHNDPATLRNMTHPEPITHESHMAWWEGLDKKKQRRFIFTLGNDANVIKRAGLVKIYDIDLHNQCCVLGADIHPRHRGKGYAKHMWRLLLDHCFNTLELHRVSLTYADFNVIGERVYRGLGFKEEGRLVQSLFRNGKFHDQICMYMTVDDWKQRSLASL